MNRLAIAAAVVTLALLTFLQFPGHTYLQQDSQIYVAILEHLRDPAVLRNEMLAVEPHVAFTLYDEAALVLRSLTALSFREVLAFQQLFTRALGIWGIFLCGTGLLACPKSDAKSALRERSARRQQAAAPLALLVAAICSLGAAIPGPSVLTIEYEPTPRAFAVPLLICAVGLATHRRYLEAGIAAAAAFLYHPPTALPFCVLYVVFLVARRQFWGVAPLAAAAIILAIAAQNQAGAGETQSFFGRLTPLQEQLQRMRTPYVWVSTWPRTLILHWVILLGILLAAFARIWREISLELSAGGAMPPCRGLRVFLLGLPILGMLSMPVSWLLLESWGWTLLPQVQPMRALLFVALFMQFLTAVAGVRAAVSRRPFEAGAWFALAYLLPLQPMIAAPFAWSRMAVMAALALIATLTVWRAPRFAPAAGAVAFFAIPLLGDVVNYPRLHTPELSQLSEWARASTARDAVFLFPDAAHALYPGIFRSEALRAVYVDWKGGGQVNYLKELGEQWWFRWQQTMAGGFNPANLPKYEALGITYVVLQPKNRLAQAPAFENAQYLAYLVR